jgi:ribosomal protein S18 acetylase RimI-like enzyme
MLPALPIASLLAFLPAAHPTNHFNIFNIDKERAWHISSDKPPFMIWSNSSLSLTTIVSSTVVQATFPRQDNSCWLALPMPSPSFMAQEDEKVIGFTQLYPSFSSISLARIFILNDLFVLKQARRRGVATTLISAAVKFATASGAARLSLSTAVTNDTAQALYHATGWKRDEQFLVYDLVISA